MALIKRTFLEARPIEVGKIKIGMRGKARKTSGGGTSYLPEKLDHFLVTTMERDGKDGPFLRDDDVHADVGEQPRELHGALMYEGIEQNLHTEMAVYKGRRRQSSCDGEECVMRDKSVKPCQKEAGCACKPYARLHLQLNAAPQTGGYYVFRTHGWASTNNLQTALEEIHRAFGTLYKAPVKLIMQKTEDTYMDGQQEKTGSSWKVGLVLDMSFKDAQEYLAAEARTAIEQRQLLMLEAGAVVADLNEADLENEAETADEFHPPVGVGASVATAEKLDKALEGITGGDDEPPVVEGDYEVEGEEIHPLVALLEAAVAGGALNEAQKKQCQDAIDSDDVSAKDIAADWLRGKCEKLGVALP